MDNNNNNKFELPPNIDDSANVSTSALPQQLPLPVVLVLSVPAILIILLTVFGNLLVLFFKARVGRTNTTLLVWNLGLTDFMVGVLVLPMGASYLLNRRWVFGQMLCRIWVGADVTFCTCSVVTICIISVDRYLAVTRPLRYKSVVTKLKVITVIILIWTFSLGILLATVRWESHQKTTENKTCYVGDEIRYLAHSVVFAFFLPASVTLTLYWRIYSLARNRQRALDRGFLMILGHNMNFLTNTLSQTVPIDTANFSGILHLYRPLCEFILAKTMEWLNTSDECSERMRELRKRWALSHAHFCSAGYHSSRSIF